MPTALIISMNVDNNVARVPHNAMVSKLTTKEIKDIECALNNRPRKKLGYGPYMKFSI